MGISSALSFGFAGNFCSQVEVARLFSGGVLYEMTEWMLCMQELERLLTEWDNRPSPFWETDALKRLTNEIRLLEALRSYGCEKTRDGLTIAEQLDECRAVLHELGKNKP